MEFETHSVKPETQQSIEEIAKNCNQLLEYPPEEGYEDYQVYLVRHGYSEHNFAMDKYYDTQPQHGHHTEEHKLAKLNIKDIDTPLHQIGVRQAQNCQKFINKLDVDTVFVSPLFRTLQTAEKLFETHSNKDQIKFVVLPQLAEGLSSSASFAPLAFTQQRKEQFTNFDYSSAEKFKNKLIWQIEQLACEETKSRLIEKFNNIIDDQTLSEIYRNETYQLYPSYLEPRDALWLRAQEAKQIIEEHKKKIPQDKKIVIVSHYTLGIFMTSSQILQDYHQMDGIRCKNSKLIPWKI